MNEQVNILDRLSIMKDRKHCYDIVFETGFANLKKELNHFNIETRKICIVTDSNVAKLYLDEVSGQLSDACRKLTAFTFPAGEASKNLDTVQELYIFLIREGFDRNDMLLALGGGVVGDLTGFCAATYLRGIDFVQLPTSLLAQVDSSIGGKTGVDFSQYKNMVGAFHMPRLVYTNLSTLRDLDARQYFSGMAEVLKAGLIMDARFYMQCISDMYEIFERDLSVLKSMIYRCCKIKKAIVEKDPAERGERALLNLGHTIGHAIEKYKNFEFLHGECVALGIVAAAFISWKKEYIAMEEYYEIRDMFVPFNLPISIDTIEPQEIVKLTYSDKKMKDGRIQFILLSKVGKAVIDHTVTENDILNAVNEIYYSEENANE